MAPLGVVTCRRIAIRTTKGTSRYMNPQVRGLRRRLHASLGSPYRSTIRETPHLDVAQDPACHAGGMPKYSAGLLPYRVEADEVFVFIAHPGGPFWATKDEGVWSIVKGEYDPDSEDAALAAGREFHEETGVVAPGQPWLDLGQAKQKSGKIVQAYAAEAPATLAFVASNTCEVQWPPRSGRIITIPEVDRAGWMPLQVARTKLIPGQTAFLDRLTELR